MLEDDGEHIHQMAVSTDIKMKIELSLQGAKQVLKWRNSEKDSTMKRTKLKIERDQTWIEALEEIETKPHASLAPIKFKSK